MMSDWFERALRICHNGPYSNSELPAIYASFKQELVDRHGTDDIREIASLIISSLFVGARQSGDLQAYLEVNLLDLKAIREERGKPIDSNDDSYRYTRAYDLHERFQFPVTTSGSIECESFTWYCYPSQSYHLTVAEIDENTGLEFGCFYIGSYSDATGDAPLVDAVHYTQKEKKP
jgi:hypothetical protein